MTYSVNPEIALLIRHSGRRVLLVEDNQLNREITQLLLSKTGLLVDTAENGHVALGLAARHAYSLIVTDLAMPGMDGVETTKKIRQLAGYENTPVIALTACVFGEDRDYCLNAGLNDFITKPVCVTKLYATVLRWLDSLEEALVPG